MTLSGERIKGTVVLQWEAHHGSFLEKMTLKAKIGLEFTRGRKEGKNILRGWVSKPEV